MLSPVSQFICSSFRYFTRVQFVRRLSQFAVAMLLTQALAAKPTVALVHTDTDAGANDVKARLLATSAFTTVDSYNVSSSTPTTSTLQQYSAVLVWSSNTPYYDPTALGNLVAAYQANGGGVVCALLEPSVQNKVHMTGAWDDTYRVWQRTNWGAVFGGEVNMIPVQPTHPLLTGVNTITLNGYYMDLSPALNPGAELIAKSSQGDSPFVATKVVNGHPVVDLGFSPASRAVSAIGWDPNTDGAILLKNALLYSINGDVSGIENWKEFE